MTVRIAVIWSRFGPYHIARLRAAAARARTQSAEIVGIEVAADDAEYAWERYDAVTDFKRHVVFSDSNYHALSAARIGDSITRALDDICPDAVAINGWAMPEARAALAWCGSRPAVRTIVMSETKEDDEERVWWKEMIKRRILRRADAALVGGRAQRDYLVKLGLATDRIFIGYDVVDNEYFEREVSHVRLNVAALREQHSLPDRFFLVCTRFLPRKNVDGLLRAYAAYRTHSSHPWALVIAGSGSEQTTLQRLERDLNLDGVIWAGFVQYGDLPLYYGLASAFVHPAKSEPWGLVINEAIASGLPVLASRTVGAAHELVVHGQNGILFDPFSDTSMTAALQELSTMNEAKLAEMGRASFEISKSWTTQRFAQGLFDAAMSNGDLEISGVSRAERCPR